MANINKHRSILLARPRTTLLDSMSIRDPKGMVVGYDASLAMDDDASARLIADAIKMKVNAQIAVFVQFDEEPARGLEVVSCLSRLLEMNGGDILPRFERFFT